jgi:hypothetical protein
MNYQQLDGLIEGISPTDTTEVASSTTQQVPVNFRPMKRLNAMTSDAASAALRRAIKSSPARWTGARNSPVEVDDEEMGSTRRLLFPSPRKDGSPKVLGEVATATVATIPTNVRSPKEQALELPNKENCPPTNNDEDEDMDLLRLFEEEMARPTTPVQKSPAPNPFKTPTRPTPSHRPITRSVSRSASRSLRSAKLGCPLFMLAQTPSRTPGSASRRRSPKHHRSVYESPFTATLNQLMSEVNENHSSPSRRCDGMQLDFKDLPTISMGGNALNHDHSDMNFNMEDFFSTDMPMPSSPPRLGNMFNLYEDPATLTNVHWNEFSELHTRSVDDSAEGGDEDAEVKIEERDELMEDEVHMIHGEQESTS